MPLESDDREALAWNEALSAWNAYLWRLPLHLGAGWWDLLCACTVEPALRGGNSGEAGSHQLVVPAPVEDEGEKALFA